MSRMIQTIEGWCEPTQTDIEYMNYLDDTFATGPLSIGLLFFKGDPTAFRSGRDDWETTRGIISADKVSA
jgi:hypothetical protein